MKTYIISLLLLLFLMGCQSIDSEKNTQFGKINLSNISIVDYENYSPSARISTVSNWKHILPTSATIVFENIRTGSKYEKTFNPNQPDLSLELPYGDYIYSCITNESLYSDFLPFKSYGEFKLNSSQIDLKLTAETSHGLVTVFKDNIKGIPTLTDTSNPILLIPIDNYYYKYVKSGLKPTLSVVENIFETTIVRQLSIESYTHYNFIVKKYNGQGRVVELLIKEFQLIEEELVSADEAIKDYIYLENYGSDLNQAWRLALNEEGKILRLHNNKIYRITEFETIEPKIKAIVGKNSTIIFGRDGFNQYTDSGEAGIIFRFTKDKPEFGVVGVNLLQAEKTIIGTQTHSKVLFSGAPGAINTGKLAWINSKPPNKDWLTIKLAGFVYSNTNGDNNDFLYVIGKDLLITGPDVSQFKANGGGGLYSILQNVEMYNPLIGIGNISYFNPTSFLADGYIQNDIYHITNDVDTYSIRTIYVYQASFRRCIIQIGRFVFNISNESVLDPKRIKLDIRKVGDEDSYIKVNANTVVTNLELHPGDITNLGKIVEKQIEFYANGNWKYKFENEIVDSPTIKLIQSSFNLSGNQKAYLVYKGNEDFWGKGLTETTEFGYDGIIRGAGYGWTMYNHKEITVHWENVKFSGFYRQSASNRGNSQGYTLINVTGMSGQFNPPVSVNTTGNIPKEAQDYINWLESLK